MASLEDEPAPRGNIDNCEPAEDNLHLQYQEEPRANNLRFDDTQINSRFDEKPVDARFEEKPFSVRFEEKQVNIQFEQKKALIASTLSLQQQRSVDGTFVSYVKSRNLQPLN